MLLDQQIVLIVTMFTESLKVSSCGSHTQDKGHMHQLCTVSGPMLCQKSSVDQCNDHVTGRLTCCWLMCLIL